MYNKWYIHDFVYLFFIKIILHYVIIILHYVIINFTYAELFMRQF